MILAMVRQVTARIPIPEDEIDNFCHKWDIKTFELFGSVLRDDFDSEHSDVDVMVALSPERRYTFRHCSHGGGAGNRLWTGRAFDGEIDGGEKRELHSSQINSVRGPACV